MIFWIKQLAYYALGLSNEQNKQGNALNHYYKRKRIVIKKKILHQLPKYVTIIQICSHWGAPVATRLWRSSPRNRNVLCSASTRR